MIAPKPLSPELAAQKGVEMFYEIVFYGLAIMIPIYEYNRGNRGERKRETEVEERLQEMEVGIRRLGLDVEAARNRGKEYLAI
jgi:hypothetical protein